MQQYFLKSESDTFNGITFQIQIIIKVFKIFMTNKLFNFLKIHNIINMVIND